MGHVGEISAQSMNLDTIKDSDRFFINTIQDQDKSSFKEKKSKGEREKTCLLGQPTVQL